jgi:hypothetical protein
METFLYALAGLFLLLFAMWIYFKAKSLPGDHYEIISGSQSGKAQTTSAATLPRSFNQAEGITYSYAGWMLVNDFTFNYGKLRRVFSKDDCPGVYLDTTSNAILVAIDTYGTKETILISNIPAKKWIHYAVVVNQYAVDIYINGILRQHHTLGQLPKQNDHSVVVGSDEGFDGTIANLTYWPRSISQTEINGFSKIVPKDIYTPPEAGSYFDMTWYTGRV